MGKKPLKVGSRGSRLAVAQVEEVLASLRPLLPDTVFETVTLDTPGDRDLQTPLSEASVPDDFFTRDLDEALLEGRMDLTVHSAKDLPASMPDGLTVAALLPADDIRDALVLRKDLADDATPTVIGTSSPRREESMTELYPRSELRPLRGAVPERLEKLDAGEYDAIIVAACALKRLGFANRISAYLPYDPAPQQGRLALVVRSKDTSLLKVLRALDVRRKAGLVAVVGCPADAAWLSDKAQSYLAQADVVLHDRLLPDAVLLQVQGKAVPVGKAGGEKSIPQGEVHRMLLEEAEQGKLVVRLQGGDPGVFGHLAEELQFLSDWNIRFDLVPTVTAVQIAAARAGAPLTHRGRGRGINILSGHTANGDDPYPGPEYGNLAIYMGVKRLADMAAKLRQAGWPEDASVVVGERVGYKDEATRTTSLAALPSLEVDIPAVFLVGVKTYTSRDVTLFVGTDPGHFLRHGPLIHWPLIRLVARPLKERIAHLEEHLAKVDGVIVPGRFAVRSFMEALLCVGDSRALAGKKLLAVGPATAEELERFGLRADLAAASLGGVRELAEHLTDKDKGRYLYPCSDAAPRDQRTRYLAPYGIDLVPCVFYGNRAMTYRDLPRTPFNRVLFTSSSTVKVYFENHPDERKANRQWIAVGPSTLEALENLGLRGETLEG